MVPRIVKADQGAAQRGWRAPDDPQASVEAPQQDWTGLLLGLGPYRHDRILQWDTIRSSAQAEFEHCQ